MTRSIGEYRELGGWVELPVNPQPKLEGQVCVDAVIVGAGLAGLCAALELTRRGLNVAVLERGFAGSGASSRNAGYLAGAQGLKYERVLASLGPEKTKQIVRFYEEGVSFAESNIMEYGIDCDYLQSGLIRAGVAPSQEAKLRKTMEIEARLGIPSVFLGETAMRERGIPPAFQFGTFAAKGGTIDPGKYIMGLRSAALRAGVTIYENSPVLSYKEGPVVEVLTESGSVSAPVLLLATNAYTPSLGALDNVVVPLRVSAIETEPLSSRQLQELGWTGREGITTIHWIMESFRLTARNTMVITTKRLRYPYRSRVLDTPEYRQYQQLHTALHDRFPSLRGIPIRKCWSGYISYASDGLPVVGVTGESQNIYYAAGCSGHGLGTQGFLGHMLGQHIGGIKSPLLNTLMSHNSPAMLPKLLRWGSLNLAFSAAGWIDDRLNRKVRTRQKKSLTR